MRHIGRAVEEVVDAVPAIGPDDGAPVLARDGLAGALCGRTERSVSRELRGEERRSLHGLSEIAEEGTGLALFDGLVEAPTCGAHEPLRIVIYPADRVRFVQVGMKPYATPWSADLVVYCTLQAYRACTGRHLFHARGDVSTPHGPAWR